MAKTKQLPAEQQGKEVVEYKPNERERAALAKHLDRRKNTPPVPKVKVVEGCKLDVDHPDPAQGWCLFMEALGTTNTSYALAILGQLANALSKGQEADQAAVNFGLAVIASVKPRDELETMLAAQMAAVHSAVMTQARLLAHAQTIPQLDINERTFNKLARTFTTQMEALKRYRSGGEQKVTVHHVTVNEGGQAIVGAVEQKTDRGEG